jgi:hypothetical protein
MKLVSFVMNVHVLNQETGQLNAVLGNPAYFVVSRCLEKILILVVGTLCGQRGTSI